jgi:hypothetical protein
MKIEDAQEEITHVTILASTGSKTIEKERKTDHRFSTRRNKRKSSITGQMHCTVDFADDILNKSTE